LACWKNAYCLFGNRLEFSPTTVGIIDVSQILKTWIRRCRQFIEGLNLKKRLREKHNKHNYDNNLRYSFRQELRDLSFCKNFLTILILIVGILVNILPCCHLTLSITILARLLLNLILRRNLFGSM
jgi:hypothetical protein